MSERGVSEKKRRRERYAVRDDAGPSGETRTRGLLLPKQAPYQLGYTRKYGSRVFPGIGAGTGKWHYNKPAGNAQGVSTAKKENRTGI